jgi:glycosyltransferase involved in cell wall biosynthesis
MPGSDRTAAEAPTATEEWQRSVSLLKTQLAERERELQQLRSRRFALDGKALFARTITATERFAPWGTLRGQITRYALGTAAVAALEVLNYRALRSRPAALDITTAGAADQQWAQREDTGGNEASLPAPQISVVIPVYNAERCDARYLREALESIAVQTYRNFEVIVVDDGSTDGSASLVEDFIASHPDVRMRLVRKTNGGQSSARNVGAAHAEGEWLTFLDQDDVWLPERLQIVIPYLCDNVDLVYTDADTIDEDGAVQALRIHGCCQAGGRHPKTCLADCLFEDCFVMPGITTVRREFFASVGGFDEHLSGYEDDDFFVRAVQAGRIDYVPVSTLQWRFYTGNYSNSGRMVRSRLRYWRKLLSLHGQNGVDRANTRRLTLRFLRQFLSQCSRQLAEGDPLAPENLRAAHILLPFVGPLDRTAFMMVDWAFKSSTPAATRARRWFLIGLETAVPPV